MDVIYSENLHSHSAKKSAADAMFEVAFAADPKLQLRCVG